MFQFHNEILKNGRPEKSEYNSIKSSIFFLFVHFSAPWMESYVFVFLQFMILLVHVYASHSILNEEEEGELEERGWPFDFDNIKKWSKLKIICSMKYSYEMHSLRDLYDCWASAIGFSIWNLKVCLISCKCATCSYRFRVRWIFVQFNSVKFTIRLKFTPL